MLGTKRNAGEMMVCSPQRYPLLTDVNNNMMGQQGDPHNNMERLQGRVRRKKLKLYNNNNSNNTNNDNNNRNRLKRRSAIYDENGTNIGDFGIGYEAIDAMRIRAKRYSI